MGFRELIEDASKRAPQARKDEIIESVIKLQGAMFDKASAYTNIIIAAGYAGSFAVWKLVGDVLDRTQRAWIGAFLLLSLIAFVIWEVAKMIMLGIQAHHFEAIRAADPLSIEKTIAEQQDAANRLTHRMGLFWVTIILPVAVGFGLAAAGLLLWAFARTIIGF